MENEHIYVVTANLKGTTYRMSQITVTLRIRALCVDRALEIARLWLRAFGLHPRFMTAHIEV